MNARSLLHDLRARGVELAIDGGGVAYRAPDGVVTPETLAALAANAEALVMLLRAEAADLASAAPMPTGATLRAEGAGDVPAGGPASDPIGETPDERAGDRADGPSPDDPRLDPARCAHCGAPKAADSLLYCAVHRDRQRERSRRAYEAQQRKGRR